MADELTPTNTQEAMLNNIAKALRGEEITEEIPVSWEHPEAFLKAILDAAKDMNPPFEEGGMREVKDVYGTYELGEYAEYEFRIGNLPAVNKHGYELIGVFHDDPPAEGSIAKIIEHEDYGDVSDAIQPDTSGKIILISDLADTGIAGDHLEIYTESLICSANFINLFDPDDPHGEGTYLPSFVEIDDDLNALLINDSVDMSQVYSRMKRGGTVWLRRYDGDFASYIFIPRWWIYETDSGAYLVFYDCDYETKYATKNFGYVAPNSDDGDDGDGGDDDGDHEGIVPPEES